jgi:hypothetical protein
MKKLLLFFYNLLMRKIGVDKVAHFGIGVFITMLCILCFGWFGIYPIIISALLFSFIAAKLKENLDAKKDNWDIIATMIGTVTMISIFFLIKFAL